MRHLLPAILALILCSAAQAQISDTASAAPLRLDLLPARKLVRTFTADARSHRLQLLKDINGKGFTGSLGAQFPVLNLHALKKILQFSVAATAYTTLERYDTRGRVVNMDFFADFLFDLELNRNWKLRGGFGHTSQHLADDALETGLTARNYVKDYVQLQTVHTLWNDRLMLYGGAYYLHNFKVTDASVPDDLSRKIMIQAGFETDVYRFTPSLACYVAADLKLRQEFDFGNTHSLQAGFKAFSEANRSMRIAYNYLAGYEERGQFYTSKATLHTAGVYFDF